MRRRLPLERICAQYGFGFFDREKSKSVASTAKRQRGLQRGKLGSPLPCFASFCRSKRKALAASGVNYAFAKGSTPPAGEMRICPGKRIEKSSCHSGTGALFAGVNGEHQTALSTLPERKQRVQAYTRFGVPLTSAFTRLIFGFQVLLERLWEWETLMPKDTSFPQISHLAIYLHLLIGQYNHATLVSYQSLRPKARTFLPTGGFWQEFCCFFSMIKYILYNTMR